MPLNLGHAPKALRNEASSNVIRFRQKTSSPSELRVSASPRQNRNSSCSQNSQAFSDWRFMVTTIYTFPATRMDGRPKAYTAQKDRRGWLWRLLLTPPDLGCYS